MTAINSDRQWEHVTDKEEKEYRNLCLTYALDTNLFNKFRRSGLGNILESGDKINGEYTLRGIRSRGKLSEFLAVIDKAKLNDSIGLPFLHNFEDIRSCSSSTIQYLGDALEIKDLVKNHKINNVIEIGGGLRRPCKNFKHFYTLQVLHHGRFSRSFTPRK